MQDHALAQLRAAKEANDDLIAFARGHRGIVESIHRAVLAAIESDDLVADVVRDWPAILGVDLVALAFADGTGALIATAGTIGPVDPLILRRATTQIDPVVIRDVERGHALFGAGGEAVRAEAVIRLDFGPGESAGILLLGQRHSPGIAGQSGNSLLRFLGQSLAAMIRRWRTTPDI